MQHAHSLWLSDTVNVPPTLWKLSLLISHHRLMCFDLLQQKDWPSFCDLMAS